MSQVSSRLNCVVLIVWCACEESQRNDREAWNHWIRQRKLDAVECFSLLHFCFFVMALFLSVLMQNLTGFQRLDMKAVGVCDHSLAGIMGVFLCCHVIVQLLQYADMWLMTLNSIGYVEW